MSLDFLNNLGFDIKNEADLRRLVNSRDSRRLFHEYPFNSMECVVLESGEGSQIWTYSELGTKSIGSIELCYVKGPLQGIKSVRWADNGEMPGARTMICLMPDPGGDLRCGIQIINAPDIMETVENRNLRLRITAFPMNIEYSGNDREPDGYNNYAPFQSQSVRGRGEERGYLKGVKSGAMPYAFLSGKIEKIRSELNDYTKKEYYIIRLCCNELLLTVAADTAWFDKTPVEGGRINGLFYMTALAENVQGGRIHDDGVVMTLALPVSEAQMKRVSQRAQRVIEEDKYCIIRFNSDFVDFRYHRVNFLQFSRSKRNPEDIFMELQFADPHVVFPPEGTEGVARKADFRQFALIRPLSEADPLIRSILQDCEIPDMEMWSDVTPFIVFNTVFDCSRF